MGGPGLWRRQAVRHHHPHEERAGKDRTRGHPPPSAGWPAEVLGRAGSSSPRQDRRDPLLQRRLMPPAQEIEMVKRTDVEFEVDGDVKLRGWLFVPPGEGRLPAITMAHGYAGVKEHGIERFAKAFAEAGFIVLLHDHRGFGASDGA